MAADPIPDHVMPDLKRAIHALDQLPNTLEVEGSSVDIATVAVALADLVKILEVSAAFEDIATIRMLVAQGKVALSLGHLVEAGRLNDKAKEILDRHDGRIF